MRNFYLWQKLVIYVFLLFLCEYVWRNVRRKKIWMLVILLWGEGAGDVGSWEGKMGGQRRRKRKNFLILKNSLRVNFQEVFGGYVFSCMYICEYMFVYLTEWRGVYDKGRRNNYTCTYIIEMVEPCTISQ